MCKAHGGPCSPGRPYGYPHPAAAEISRNAAAGSGAPKIAEPATKSVAPASAHGPADHQVDVEDHVEIAQGLDGVRAHRQRRHEVPVHDVDVDHARADRDDLFDLLAQAPEVGREDRGGDVPVHTSMSMLPPHT